MAVSQDSDVSQLNPYNCTLPGNLFVGYREEIRRVMSGLMNGRSFAVLGGKKCGKTSFLLSVEQAITRDGVRGFGAVPRMIDLAARVPHSVFDFFQTIYREVVKGLAQPDWERPLTTQPYQEFLDRVGAARTALENKYGSNWLPVLLIDKLDLAKSPNGEIFHNLRNLLQMSDLRRHFRLIATGGSDMYNLVVQGSPLSNVLDPAWLRRLTEPEADELAGAAMSLPPDIRTQLFDLSGRHAFVLQGVLEILWESRDQLEAATLRLAARRFERDRGIVFEHWVRVLGPERTSVYRAIADSEPGTSLREIRRRSKVGSIDEPIRVLSFHGIIDSESDPESPGVAGTVFRDWFSRNAAAAQLVDEVPAEQPAQRPDPRRNVFVVYGRDKRRQVAMFTFLRSLKLVPLEWGELAEKTGPAPYVGDILRTGFKMAHAAVVLLTGDDEARLREGFRSVNDEPFESELTPQPRPNVLFEAGMAMALFPERTVLVHIGKVRPMTDILGRHIVRLTNAYDDRLDFARRLRAAGCEIDVDSSTRWQTDGDFDS